MRSLNRCTLVAVSQSKPWLGHGLCPVLSVCIRAASEREVAMVSSTIDVAAFAAAGQMLVAFPQQRPGLFSK